MTRIGFCVFVSLCALAGVSAKCPAPFQPWVHGRCLLAKPSPITYGDAVNACASDNGILASIHSAEDNAKIAKTAADYDYHIYLGLTCNATTNKFQWLDGTPLDYTNFQGGVPAGCAGASQVTFDPKTGLWTAYANAGYNSYLCEYIHDDEYPCDFGYDYLEEAGMCVHAYKDGATWNEAELTCRQRNPGSHLVSIHNEESNRVLAQYALSKGFTAGIHIGLNQQSGNLTWEDGTEIDYSNFQPGMPIDAFGKCIAQRSQTAQWLSVHCDSHDLLPFLCAVPAFLPTTTIQPPGCSSSAYFENRGDIYSPGFPISVDAANLTCDYYLFGDEGTRVKLTFDVFELNSCCDSLEVYEGNFGGQPMLVLTGELDSGYQVTTDTNNVMRLVLKIGDGRGVRGFHASFISRMIF